MPEDKKSTLIKNARLLDPAIPGFAGERPIEVLIRDGKIARIGVGLVSDGPVIDAKGMHLFPSFCDPHVHFRTPGQTEKEDIESGSRAALAGGYTSVVQMPNTVPTVDSPELVRELTRDDPIELRVMGAVTKGLESSGLVDLHLLADAGAVAFSNDGQPVSDDKVMYWALEVSITRHLPIASHAEDKTVGEQGPVRAGVLAEALGVKGWDARREWAMVERDIEVLKKVGGHLHECHVSTRQAVELISRAKKDRQNVSAEATPHHLTLTADIVKKMGADAKMNPPLGDEEDREALIAALAEGTIDCIATDHAPHTRDEKSKGLNDAPFGVVGLETSFAVCYTELVKKGRIGLGRLIEAMSHNPRKIFNLEPVGLFEGSRADLVLVDLEREWTVDPEEFQSKGRSTPFAGNKVSGKVMLTIHRGEIQWRLDW